MIDFRYHIVSLISVFLALAVGIVLGAGPLRDYIAESLSGQVDLLRKETEELRDALEAREASLADANAFIAEASDTLIDGVLPSYTVNLVALPGADSAYVNTVGDTLTSAGASVLNIVELTSEFTDPGKRPFRSGIAGNLAPYMDPEPGDDASPEAIIGAALDQGLTSYDQAAPQEPSDDAVSIIDLLRSSDLLTVDGDVLPTLLTVIIASDSPDSEEVRAAELGLVKGFSPERTLVAGADEEGTLVNTVRSDSESSERYTTTDSPGTDAGRVIIPRALAALVAGEHGSYGFALGVDATVPPAVDISAPEPVVPVEDPAGEESGDGADESSSGAGPDPESAGPPGEGARNDAYEGALA